MTIYTGAELTNLMPVSIFASSASRGVGTQTFDAIGGTTYEIQVAGYSPAFTLTLSLAQGFYGFSVSVYPSQSGSVTVSPPPLPNGLYAAGTTLTLSEQPAQGWSFTGWAGDASGTNAMINLVLNRSLNVHAVFGFGAFNIVHTFGAGDPDGVFPYSRLLASSNTLYGTTFNGGTNGSGTIFSISIDGTGFKILHSFTPLLGYDYTNSDGATPGQGSLVLLGRTLYGTTPTGGTSGYGTVFAINTDGTGFATLHSFTGADGSEPDGALLLSSNVLYGETSDYPTAGFGTLFSLNIDGTTFTTLHTFTGGDGTQPFGGLIIQHLVRHDRPRSCI
jgi:uncharacterized repeat protein (TIGR03803 family)